MSPGQRCPGPGLAATVDDAARYLADRLADQRLLEATDPRGWALARGLGRWADALGAGSATAAHVEATLPRGRPHSGDPRSW